MDEDKVNNVSCNNQENPPDSSPSDEHQEKTKEPVSLTPSATPAAAKTSDPGKKVEEESNNTEETNKMEEASNTEKPSKMEGTSNMEESNQKDESKKTEAKNKTELLLEKEEFSYIQRDAFTSEIFKIEIQNMPRFGFSELRKKLLNLDMRPIKIKGFPHNGYAFVTFRNEEDREAAISKLHGFQWKGHRMTAKKSRPTADPLVLKRKEAPVSEQNSKRQKLDSDANDPNENLTPDERLKKAVMPMHDLPYSEQLNVKSSNIKSILVKLTWDVHNNCPELRKWLKEQKSKNSGCICEILPIMPSPVLTGYRNKSEFTIGMNLDGTEPMVGFRFGSYRDGSSAVGDPSNCTILPDAMAKVAKIFQGFVRQNQYTVYDAQTHDGYWRQLTVRTTTIGNIMVIPEFCSQELNSDDIEEVKKSLKTFFSEGPGKECGVTSLYFNCVNRHASTGRCTDYQFLMGEEWITENLLEMKFQISPDAFFQVNNMATALLYNQVADWCCLDADNIVLDICCGTGTIGLTLAKHVKKVIGVEMSARAVEDAKRNAVLNGVENIEFHCAKVEDVTEQIKIWAKFGKVVAIVDPPRPGLHGKVMYALRRCRQIHRLIYVSCNPNAAIQNFMDLIRPVSRRIKGDPFYPVKAIPVDLFPHTKHCELVTLFERQQTNSATEATN